MTTMTKAHLIVPEDAPRTVWMFERGEGVTASEALDVARAGIRARRTILEAKMNGSTFRGNKATKAGSAREAALLDEAGEHMASLTPNAALWGAVDNHLHRATPDAIAVDGDDSLVVVEVKSHEHGYKGDRIPPEHMAQMQFQIYVLGAAYALYGSEIRDEDDMPPAAGATWTIVPRDDEMIAWLSHRADDFIAWREAGCPDYDELPDDAAAALATWAPLKRELDEKTKEEKTANAALKKVIEALPHAARFGAVAMGPDGGFQISVSESFSIDETAWAAADPEGHARAEEIRVELAFIEAAALRAHPKAKRTTSLRFQEVENA